MMKMIKFPIGTHGVKKITMAICAKVMHVTAQNGSVTLWVMVPADDSQVTKTERHFEMVYTGETILSSPSSYLGTAMLDNGCLSVHVFEFLPN